MKVNKKDPQMELDDALNGLHLSNTKKQKRRRWSGISKNVIPTFDESTEETDEVIESTSQSNEATKDQSEEEEEVPSVRRTTRKKSAPIRWNPLAHVTEPKTVNTNEKDIEKYYLDKTVKKGTTSLETIFEEESNKDNSHKTMSNKKYRRFLQLDKVTKGRIKKRKDNIRKFGIKQKKSIKSTLEELHRKLCNLVEEG